MITVSPKHNFHQLLAIDRPIAYSLALRAWNGLAGPVTLSLIASRLNEAEQGFFYSFAGVQALSVVGELGMAFVIGQFAAHEKAAINAGLCDARIATARARLASILILGMKWNIVASALCVITVTPFGLWFFQSAHGAGSVDWMLPWFLFSVLSSMGIALAPGFAVLESIGHIGDTSLIRLACTVVGGLLSWWLLIAGYKLMALVALPAMSLVLGALGIYFYHRNTLVEIMKHAQPNTAVRFWKEIFPLQSRVALSWLSGYVGFYMATPIIFRVISPEVAGQYGMTANLLLSISSVAQIWINTRNPEFAYHAGAKRFSELFRIFRESATRATCVLLLGYGIVLVGKNIAILLKVFPFLGRLLDGWPLMILVIGFSAQFGYCLINSLLRAFKEDPLFATSIAVAAVNVLCIQYCCERWGIAGAGGLFMVCQAAALGIGTLYLAARVHMLANMRRG